MLLALRQGGVDVGTEAINEQPELREPVVEQFRVGTLTLGWDGDRERVVIEARELTDEEVSEDEDEDEDEENDDDDEKESEEIPVAVTRRPVIATDVSEGPDVVRVQLEPEAALAFATGAVATVQAGRPPCPLCGAPLDPTGHFCTRRNGYTN